MTVKMCANYIQDYSKVLVAVHN